MRHVPSHIPTLLLCALYNDLLYDWTCPARRIIPQSSYQAYSFGFMPAANSSLIRSSAIQIRSCPQKISPLMT